VAARGIQDVPLRVPERWDPAWFASFVRDVLALADVRNAIPGSGIEISGNSDKPATISSSEDLQQLIDENYVLAESTSLLANARVLAGEPNVLEVIDSGPGQPITIRVAVHGISFSKMRFGTAFSVVGNPGNAAAELTGIAADANDTVLRRVSNALGFGQLTVGMAPDDLWTNAKLADMADSTIKGRASGAGSGDPQDLTTAQVKAILALSFSDIDGSVADGQVPGSAVTQHQAALAIQFSQLTGTPRIPGGLTEYADDSAAAAGGVPVNGLYRTGSAVKIRVA
jgi:hypothetical protein